MQLRVEKCDGSIEIYLHTKVMGSIAAGLSDGGCYEPDLPEQLAEAVTTFLRRRYGSVVVSADEIHSMIVAALSDTGSRSAALALQEHRITRQMMRSRTEVIHWSSAECPDRLDYVSGDLTSGCVIEPWDKSEIVRDLEAERGLVHTLARAVAGSVEEKVLRMGCRRMSTGQIREMVMCDLFAMRQAEMALAEQPRKEIEPLEAVG